MAAGPDETALRGLLDDAIRDAAGFAVDLDASFFEAGLTSALLLGVHRRLESTLGRQIPFWLLFRHPTRRSLARQLSGAVPAAPVDAPVPETSGARSATEARRALRSQIRGTGR
jgi:Phosphopantetheine attachment site